MKKILSFWNGKTLLIAIPYLWMTLFFLIPFFIVFKISFSETQIAIPPYTDLITQQDGKVVMTLNLGNYLYLFTDNLYLSAYLNSLKIAAISTLLCLLIGYPIAYAIATARESIRNLLLLLIILPSWTSFLIRIYAWIGILKNEGLLNNFLQYIGITSAPIQLIYNDFSIYVGIVYAYLPFMILPLYTNLTKHDPTLLEAAADLGCRPIEAFIKVTLPLSISGIIAGSMLVFIPIVGEFVIPSLLGGPDNLMIGKVLWDEFFSNRDWPVASAVTVVMLTLLMIPILLFQHIQRSEIEGK